MYKYYKLLIVSSIVLLIALAMWIDRTSITPEENSEGITQIHAGTISPDVTFTLLDGGSLKLHSLAGHKVLLHFFASWCAPCRTEFPGLLARVEKDPDIILVAVSGDMDIGDAKHFVEPYKRDYASLFKNGRVVVATDPELAITQGVFQTFQYPETIIIAPDLTMREKIVGIYAK